MRFCTGLPGLTRYPPELSPAWADHMTGPDFQRVARTVEDLGFDAISVPEHIVMPNELAPNMGTKWPHAFTVMAYVMGATAGIAVNAAVIVLPFHPAVSLAKAVATLDVLSGGRVMLGFGVGHTEGEFRALGIPFEKRGRMADEYLEAMQILWTEDDPSFEGEFVSFRDIQFEPKPVQRPHPPIWIGGNSDAALRRAVRYGQGWTPWLVKPDALPGRLDLARAMPEFVAKADGFDIMMPPVPIRVSEADHSPLDNGTSTRPSSAQAVIDAIGTLEAIGVTWTSIPNPGPPAASLSEHLDQLAWAAETVIPVFREG